jgi:hypothetical protein
MALLLLLGAMVSAHAQIGGLATGKGDRTQTTVWEIANNNPFGNRHREQSWGHGTQRTKFGFDAPAPILS